METCLLSSRSSQVDGGVEVVNRDVEFRKCYGLGKPSMLWESVRGWSVIDEESLLKEMTLKLQLYRLSGCSIGEGKMEVVGGAISGGGRSLHQSRNARESGDAMKK